MIEIELEKIGTKLIHVKRTPKKKAHTRKITIPDKETKIQIGKYKVDTKLFDSYARSIKACRDMRQRQYLYEFDAERTRLHKEILKSVGLKHGKGDPEALVFTDKMEKLVTQMIGSGI